LIFPLIFASTLVNSGTFVNEFFIFSGTCILLGAPGKYRLKVDLRSRRQGELSVSQELPGAGGKVTGGILERGGSERLSRGFSKVMGFSLTSFRPPGRPFKGILAKNPGRPLMTDSSIVYLPDGTLVGG